MNPEAHQDAESIVGVISAFRAEVSSLAGSLIDPRSVALSGRSAWEGRLGTSRVLIVPGGMGPGKAADAARALMTKGVSAVLCTGAAGALDPALQVGDLVLAEWVMEAKREAGKSVCDPIWGAEAKRKAEQGGFRATSGGVISVNEPASSPGEKDALRKASGGSAVDMESAAVGGLVRGMPYLSVRVITDDAHTTLPDFRRGWKHPVRTLTDGAGFLTRAGVMRRALQTLQEFLARLLADSSPAIADRKEPNESSSH